MIEHSDPILITGGTGFVGSHLVDLLLAKGYTQLFVTSYSSDPGYLAGLLPKDHLLPIDLRNRTATAELIKAVQPKWIFHLASIAIVGSSFEKAAEVFQNNISLQLSVLDAVRAHVPDARVLVIGSGMEYGVHLEKEAEQKDGVFSETDPLNPVSPYAVSKATQDLLGLSYALSYNLDIVRVRPFNHIGERQTLDFAIPSFAHQIAQIEQGKQEKISVGNLAAVRDFTDVKDVVRAYLLLMEQGKQAEVYNVGSGKGWTMREILDVLCSLSTTQIDIEVDQSRLRPLDVPVAIAKIEKIKKLGWEPEIELKATLQRILDEWRGKSQQ